MLNLMLRRNSFSSSVSHFQIQQGSLLTNTPYSPLQPSVSAKPPIYTPGTTVFLVAASTSSTGKGWLQAPKPPPESTSTESKRQTCPLSVCILDCCLRPASLRRYLYQRVKGPGSRGDGWSVVADITVKSFRWVIPLKQNTYSQTRPGSPTSFCPGLSFLHRHLQPCSPHP